MSYYYFEKGTNSELQSQKRPTKRAPDAGDSAAISSSFTRLIIFLAGRLRRPHPSAGNANRWAFTQQETKCKQSMILLNTWF